jgi:membrane-associated phospholipid phosphatase
VFSIFLIAASVALWRPYVAVVLAFLGVALAISRVLLGIHYVRDVVCGAILGTVSGIIGSAVTYAIL